MYTTKIFLNKPIFFLFALITSSLAAIAGETDDKSSLEHPPQISSSNYAPKAFKVLSQIYQRVDFDRCTVSPNMYTYVAKFRERESDSTDFGYNMWCDGITAKCFINKELAKFQQELTGYDQLLKILQAGFLDSLRLKDSSGKKYGFDDMDATTVTKISDTDDYYKAYVKGDQYRFITIARDGIRFYQTIPELTVTDINIGTTHKKLWLEQMSNWYKKKIEDTLEKEKELKRGAVADKELKLAENQYHPSPSSATQLTSLSIGPSVSSRSRSDPDFSFESIKLPTKIFYIDKYIYNNTEDYSLPLQVTPALIPFQKQHIGQELIEFLLTEYPDDEVALTVLASRTSSILSCGGCNHCCLRLLVSRQQRILKDLSKTK